MMGGVPAADLRSRQWSMLVGGELRPAGDRATCAVRAPATGELLAEVPDATTDDVDAAVAAADRAAAEWRAVPVRQRAAALRSVAALLRRHRDELGWLDALDTGNPVTAMRGDVDLAVDLIEHYADWSLALSGSSLPGDGDHLHYTVRQPFGVVGRIVPYNHPLMFSASRLAAPLLAGNTVVMKAPDQAPLSALRLGELVGEALPPGTVSFLSGAGSRVGPALVGHPSVRRVAFTGSVGTGQAVLQAAAAAGIKTVTLELGGKNPMLVLPDATPAEAAAGAVVGMNFHWTGGQSCGSTSRLLVHRRLVDEVVEAVVDGARRVVVGDPLEAATEMGSMITPEHRDRVLGYIDHGRAEGLRLATGGGVPAGVPAAGAFVEPTVFVGVPPTSRLWRKEIFGPVLVVTPFDDDDLAVRMINDGRLGLTASIWTNDLSRAHRLAAAVEAGYVWVNTASRHFVGMPFGGVKDSGMGREESVEEVWSFTETKAVTVRLGPAAP